MGASSKRNFFIQNGKSLRIPLCETLNKERVSTLFDGPAKVQVNHSLSLIERMRSIKLNKSNLNISLLAAPSGLIFAVLIFSILVKTFGGGTEAGKYSIFSSRPLTLVEATQEVDSKDSRSQKINEVFKDFNCPLEGLGEIFVREADKNDIPWWLVASVAFQESSCGKNTPKLDGNETYNAWGWEVYGNTAHSFDNWARGIETVSAYFQDKFYSKGTTSLCDIMKVYTPNSNGSWCRGVQEFSDIIQAYKTP
jgi:hypothetical protein